MRRSLTAALLAAVVVLGLTGCYPTAANAIGDLERFAMQLDGVESVETLTDEPENMAFPFGGTALGVAAVHLDADSWRESLPEVALAVQDWLATDQKRDKVKLSVGIVFPIGAVGLAADASETRDRLQLVESLADDSNLTGFTVGFSSGGSIDLSNDTATVTLARNANASVASVLAGLSPILGGFAPDAPLEITSDADRSGTDAAVGNELRREFVATSSIQSDSPIVTWVDGVDAITAITGWRVDDVGEATVYATDAAALDSLEAELRGLPGAEAVTSLSLVTPELTIDGGGTDSVAARELATALVAAGISSVSVSDGEVTVGALDVAGARVVLQTAAAVPGAEVVRLDLTINLAASGANPCACIRVGGATPAYLADVLPTLLELDPQSLDSVWVRAEDAVDASYESDDQAAMGAFLAAVHEQAIARGTSVAVSSDAGNDYYIVMFDAQPQITADDVWSGNHNAPQDKRHAQIIKLWNALDN